jgi:uncharacterized phage infection (PIP) family protein YhgE
MLVFLYVLLTGANLTTAGFPDIGTAQSRVASVIEAPDKQEQARQLLREMEAQVNRHEDVLRAGIVEVRSALSEPAADQELIQASLDKQLKLSRAHNEHMLALRFQLRDQLSREQWEGLFPRP